MPDGHLKFIGLVLYDVKTLFAPNFRHCKAISFTHVIVSTGIFNVPNKPAFPGMETFTGRIIHSHDFRDAYEFKGQRLLIVGASYSAEDIALQCLKFGAKSVLTSYRSNMVNV
jgi:cation diffusion facilitator CzcD-associated flavoprotein CzcO